VLRVRRPGALVEVAPASEDIVLAAEMALVGRYIADRAVTMFAVVPSDEELDPPLRSSEVGEGYAAVARRGAVLQPTACLRLQSVLRALFRTLKHTPALVGIS
jgi:hypothetical protein